VCGKHQHILLHKAPVHARNPSPQPTLPLHCVFVCVCVCVCVGVDWCGWDVHDPVCCSASCTFGFQSLVSRHAPENTTPCHWIQVDLNLTCAQAMSRPFTLCALEHRLAVAHGTFEDVVNAVGGRDGTHSCVLPVCVFQCARVCCARMRVHEKFCQSHTAIGQSIFRHSPP